MVPVFFPQIVLIQSIYCIFDVIIIDAVF